MKRHLDWLARAQRRTIAAGALFAISAFASLLGPTWADATQAPTGSAAPTSKIATDSKTGETGGIDALIKHLHDTFKITVAQEESWEKVANVMRENAETMSKLAKTRSEGAKTMTAVDDLRSYAEISEAHAEGTKENGPRLSGAL